MFENLINSAILENPLFIAAVLALVRNLGGYAYNCFEAHKLLPYSASQLLVTLGLWETVFVILSGATDLGTSTTAVIAIVLDFMRGLKTAISTVSEAPTAAPEAPKEPVITYGPWTKTEDLTGAVLWCRAVFQDGVQARGMDGWQYSKTDPTTAVP
jgi:hypothetical protein